MISLVQASITSTSGLLPESVRIWFFLSSGSTIKKLWGCCQEGLRTGWDRIGDGVDAGAGTAHLRAQRAGFARMCTHTVHIHKIQIAHMQDILHTRTILYLEAGHTHWVIIEVRVCGRFLWNSASSSE